MEITAGRRRRVAGMTIAGLALALALAGCSADGGDDAAGLTGGSAGDAAAPVQPNAGTAGGPAESRAEAPGAAPVRLRQDERSLIYTGTLTVRAEDPEAAADKAITIVTGSGGFVGGDRRTVADERSEVTLTLRVPADRFARVLDDLAQVGDDEESRDIETQDVTEEVVDLDARLASQQASVNRTRTLLAQARTIGEIVSVEGELAKREAELASLQAKKRRLADLTSLSTITLSLLGPDAAAPPGDATGFWGGLRRGWSGFLTSMNVLLTVLGVLLPWVLALGLPLYGAYWLNRRLRRNAAAAAVPAPATPANREP